jgi:thioesterase domain-containing protein
LPDQPERPATEIEGRLLALWGEFLGITGLGVNDDYFALGGASLVAARLFSEIERQFGVKLPLTTILDSPTVRTLSLALEAQRTERSDVLVELKCGDIRNLFLVHDGDGETLLYLNLARRMPDDVAVFGIEPRHLKGVPLAHGRIEDMAAFYVEQVRRKQPRGPYRLGGMCAGGVIAYEMASQLERDGENVGMVIVLDAATPQAAKRPGRLTKQRMGRLAHILADARSKHRSPVSRALAATCAIARKLVSGLSWEVKQRSTEWSVRARFRLLRGLLTRGLPWPRFVPELSVRQIYNAAEAHYAPQRLSKTAVTLARAQAGEAGDTPYVEIYAEETLGWGAIADNVAIVDVAGGHFSMLQEPFVENLAKALVPRLDERPGLAPVQRTEGKQWKDGKPPAVRGFVLNP